jgi:hypothetical protein
MYSSFLQHSQVEPKVHSSAYEYICMTNSSSVQNNSQPSMHYPPRNRTSILQDLSISGKLEVDTPSATGLHSCFAVCEPEFMTCRAGQREILERSRHKTANCRRHWARLEWGFRKLWNNGVQRGGLSSAMGLSDRLVHLTWYHLRIDYWVDLSGRVQLSFNFARSQRVKYNQSQQLERGISRGRQGVVQPSWPSDTRVQRLVQIIPDRLAYFNLKWC